MGRQGQWPSGSEGERESGSERECGRWGGCTQDGKVPVLPLAQPSRWKLSIFRWLFKEPT
jgi:hypothetical protein